jgi:hypothetical protein
MNATLSVFHTKSRFVVCLLTALGGYLLWMRTGRTLVASPYLLLLARSLMHFVGHHHGPKHHGEADRRSPRS